MKIIGMMILRWLFEITVIICVASVADVAEAVRWAEPSDNNCIRSHIYFGIFNLVYYLIEISAK